MEQIINKLVDFLDEIGIEESIFPSSTLNSLDLDSTERADFSTSIETEFDISLDDYKLGEMTLQEIAQIVSERAGK